MARQRRKFSAPASSDKPDEITLEEDGWIFDPSLSAALESIIEEVSATLKKNAALRPKVGLVALIVALLWLVFVGVVVVLSGFVTDFEVTEAVQVALLSSATVAVVGIFASYAKYLFSSQSDIELYRATIENFAALHQHLSATNLPKLREKFGSMVEQMQDILEEHRGSSVGRD